MIKVYEIDVSIKYGKEPNAETEINRCIEKEGIIENNIISISKSSGRINLFVKQ